jgi:hypothetical protein
MAVDRLQHLWPGEGTRREPPPVGAGSFASPAWRGWLERIGQAVGTHPGTAIAAALSVGVTLGWLIKRR